MKTGGCFPETFRKLEQLLLKIIGQDSDDV